MRGISMRWWLGLAFAAIVALTALSITEVFNHRAGAALHTRGEAIAIGQSVSAAQAVSQALGHGVLDSAAPVIADRRRLALFVFSPDGHLVTDPMSRGVAFRSIPDGVRALRSALQGRRFVESESGGSAFVVGLGVHASGGAVVTYTSQPELSQDLGLVQNAALTSALFALGLGAVAGLLVATLIAARLRRIAHAAADIEAGDFGRPLQVRFHDEVGSLAVSFEQMRQRLQQSFARLATERDRLHELLDGLEEGVVAVDSEVRVTYANGSARRQLAAAEPREGEPLPEPWPDFALRAFAGNLFDDLSGRVVHARIVAGDRTFALAGIPAPGGTRDGMLVFTDITERERRDRAEREFVTNAAHELGTPVAAISVALEALLSGAKDVPDERDRFLALIDRQTGRLIRLRRALLSLARAQTGQEALALEPVAVRPLLEAVAGEVRRDGLAVEVDCDERVAVLAHAELLEQILLNLTDNALRHGEPAHVELRARAEGEHVVAIEVTDDGRGVQPSSRERLFDRFYRSGGDGEGFGLGLAIVREATRALGGSVSIGPRRPTGTVARLRLAAARPVRVS